MRAKRGESERGWQGCQIDMNSFEGPDLPPDHESSKVWEEVQHGLRHFREAALHRGMIE